MKQIRMAGAIIGCLVLLSGISKAQEAPKYIDIDLWEKGVPTHNGKEGQPVDEEKRIYKPSIRIFLPPKETATGRAIITYPGGGYGMLAYHHEGYDFAPFFNNQGIALIVLKYRMPYGHREVPFSDAEEAMRLVKQHAAEWHIKPNDIGIMGSSAGGHLASTYATHSKAELRPAFQILLYPVITMDSTYAHMGSRKNLLGNNPGADLIKLYSNEKQVTKETPRAFIVLSDDDKVVLPANSVNYYLALTNAGVPAALHIYPTGGHGWGINEDFRYKEEFLLELREWLRSF